MSINIYCDESCHLQNDHKPIMTLGAIQALDTEKRAISIQIRDLKKKYHCTGELKWTKVSDKNILFYLDLIDLFIKNPNLSFRALIVHNKENLDHKTFNDGDHDNFYYKMYYDLLKNIIENHPSERFNVFLDIKDTKSSVKVYKLHEVLSNKFYDFDRKKITRIQQIRSHESNLLQLCDFLLGAVTYINKDDRGSTAKLQISEALSKQTGFRLTETTPPWETKFNLFHFSPRVSF